MQKFIGHRKTVKSSCADLPLMGSKRTDCVTRSKDNNAFEWSNIYLTVNRCFSELDHHHQSRDSGRRVKFSKIAQQKKKKRRKSTLPKGGVRDKKIVAPLPTPTTWLLHPVRVALFSTWY